MSAPRDDVRRGIPFIISAPSGTGKTTVCRELVGRDAGLEFSISHTTRPRRGKERDGVDYHFVTAAEFRELVQQGRFIEHAEYAGHIYGSSVDALEPPLASGVDLVVEIEVQGARQIRDSQLAACFIFLLPPSLEELEARLRGRGTDDDETIEQRLALVDRELAAVEFFDYAVVNDDLEDAIEAVSEIIQSERCHDTQAVRRKFGCPDAFEPWSEAQADHGARKAKESVR